MGGGGHLLGQGHLLGRIQSLYKQYDAGFLELHINIIQIACIHIRLYIFETVVCCVL